ncbi:MAG: ribonuclease H [Spirochaetales bacterium]|jgi:ribonuclease HI|nr:ribonuclease H [Spirochaetales bacterium]|tara:strand:+ start:8247 stop:8654 length:408 start_codon:yes stop_codon:yes gene_type:complete
MNFVVKIFIDGACQPNPGSGGVGIYIVLNKSEEKYSRPLKDIVTNNIAEYEALILALKLILDKDITAEEVQIFSDSKLICMQFNNQWKCKDAKLLPLLRQAIELHSRIKSPLKLSLIPREENSIADKLAKSAILP